MAENDNNIPETLEIKKGGVLKIEEETNENAFTPEELEAIKDTVAQKGKEKKEEKEIKTKVISAERNKLFARVNRRFDILLPIEEEEDGTLVQMKFVARRLSGAERASLTPVKPAIIGQELTEEDYLKNELQGYEVLERSIVEPSLNSDEWQQIDTALTDNLLREISRLQIETNDGDLFSHYLNLSKMSMNSNLFF